MDRAVYNACMKPHMGGKGKSKEERKMGMCVGAKLCTGKAKTEAEAIVLCNKPKLPSWAKTGATEKKVEEESCDVRNGRVRDLVRKIRDSIQAGETDELPPLLSTCLKDIHKCRPDDVAKLADDTFSNIKNTTKYPYFKNEGKEMVQALDLLMSVMEG